MYNNVCTCDIKVGIIVFFFDAIIGTELILCIMLQVYWNCISGQILFSHF